MLTISSLIEYWRSRQVGPYTVTVPRRHWQFTIAYFWLFYSACQKPLSQYNSCGLTLLRIVCLPPPLGSTQQIILSCGFLQETAESLLLENGCSSVTWSLVFTSDVLPCSDTHGGSSSTQKDRRSHSINLCVLPALNYPFHTNEFGRRISTNALRSFQKLGARCSRTSWRIGRQPWACRSLLQ
jgi:hypothetical protein